MPIYSGGGGGTGGGISVSTPVTLDNAAIKALPTTGVEIVPAPAAGLMLVPFLCWMHFTFNTADYTNIGDTATVRLDYGATGTSALGAIQEVGNQVSNLLADGASHAAYMAARSYVAAVFDFTGGVGQFEDDPGPVAVNLRLKATNSGTHTGDFTGGNAGNSLKVWVYYATVTL